MILQIICGLIFWTFMVSVVVTTYERQKNKNYYRRMKDVEK